MKTVSADIRYLDGTLAGLTIPDGHRVGMPTLHDAIRVAGWLTRVRDSNDFIRAACTGHRYQVVGEIRITDIGEAH